jgi:hypothetical protein
LFCGGEAAELAGRLPRQLQEARERGDLHAEASVANFGGTLAWLAADDPEGARGAMRRAMGQWSQQEYHTQHFTSLAGHTQIDLYGGDGRAAWERLAAEWPALEGSLLLHIQAIRVFMVHLRGRSALAAAANAPESVPLLRAAAADARRLEREKTHWAKPLAMLIRAALSASRGRTSDALALLALATTGLDAAKMGLFAAAARRRQGELLGGQEGLALVAEADAWMMSQRIRNPARMTALQAPGFRD